MSKHLFIADDVDILSHPLIVKAKQLITSGRNRFVKWWLIILDVETFIVDIFSTLQF